MRCVMMLCIVVASAAGADWAWLMDHAGAQELSGNYQDAAAGYEAAMHLAERFDSDDARIPFVYNRLGMTYDYLGRFSDAVRLYRRGLTWVERVKGRKAPEYGTLLNNLAGVYLEQGRFDEGEPLIRQAIAILTAVVPDNDQRLAISRSSLADVLVKRGRYKESEQLLEQAIRVFEEKPGAGCNLGISRNNLAVVRRFQKRYQEAVELLERAVADIETNAGPNHPLLANATNNLGMAYAGLARPLDADQAFRRSIAIAGERLGTEHPRYGVMLHNYALFLRHSGRKAEAKTLETQSRAVIRESALRNSSGLVVDASAFRQ